MGTSPLVVDNTVKAVKNSLSKVALKWAIKINSFEDLSKPGTLDELLADIKNAVLSNCDNRRKMLAYLSHYGLNVEELSRHGIYLYTPIHDLQEKGFRLIQESEQKVIVEMIVDKINSDQ